MARLRLGIIFLGSNHGIWREREMMIVYQKKKTRLNLSPIVLIHYNRPTLQILQVCVSPLFQNLIYSTMSWVPLLPAKLLLTKLPDLYPSTIFFRPKGMCMLAESDTKVVGG